MIQLSQNHSFQAAQCQNFHKDFFFIKALGFPKCVLHNADFETLIGCTQKETLFKQIKNIKLEKLILKIYMIPQNL